MTKLKQIAKNLAPLILTTAGVGAGLLVKELSDLVNAQVPEMSLIQAVVYSAQETARNIYSSLAPTALGGLGLLIGSYIKFK